MPKGYVLRMRDSYEVEHEHLSQLYFTSSENEIQHGTPGQEKQHNYFRVAVEYFVNATFRLFWATFLLCISGTRSADEPP